MYHCLHIHFVLCEKFSLFGIVFLFWPYCAAYGILVSLPTIKPMPLALEAQSYHWTTMEDPMKSFLELIILYILGFRSHYYCYYLLFG